MDDMFRPSIDPYELLIVTQERLNVLEHAHNRLATDYQKTQQDLNVLLISHQWLQKSQQELLATVQSMLQEQELKK